MVEVHNPTKLEFYNLSMYRWNKGSISFESNKGHKFEVALLEEETKIVKSLIEAGRVRAMKEIPEMIAEVIAEERVAQILAKREQEALELKSEEEPIEEQIEF